MTDEAHPYEMEPGQAITCERGHVVAIARERTLAGKGDWMARMEWIQSAPAEGQPAACLMCGGLWLFHHTMPTLVPMIYRRQSWLCVDGKWTRPLTPAAQRYLEEQG